MSQSKENFQYRLIRFALNMLARIPRGQLVHLAGPIANVWYGLDHYHRRIAFENMSIAFGGEITKGPIKAMVRANFVQLVRVVLEGPSLLKLNKENVDDYVEFSGQEYLKTALAEDKGVLFLTAHLGNWELMALAASLKYGMPFNILVRPIDFLPMDRVLTEIRSRTGNRVFDKDKSANVVGRLLSENETVSILLDQNSSWYEGVYVPFFGEIACTNKGLAMFAMRYGAAVLPVFNVRLKNGKYRIIIDPPVKLMRSGDIGADIVENTTRFNKIIEKYIRMAPDNWLWVHRRWRIKDIPERARKKN